jgi:glycerate kinase
VRVVVAPDSFGTVMSARQSAEAIAAGWSQARPHDELVLQPMSDGGPGFLESIAGAVAGELRKVSAVGLLGRTVRAEILIADDTAYIESAQACGLQLLGDGERDPARLDTGGVGDLIRTAGGLAPKVVVGLGGSATNDGGTGMLERLGMRFLGPSQVPLAPLPIRLEELERVEFAPPELPRLVGAADVGNPLLGERGATAIFGRQKGSGIELAVRLERALGRLVEVIARDLPASAGLDRLPGAGSAGGLGYAVALLGGTLQPGIDLVLEAVGFDHQLRGADLVVTGEGSLDRQSLGGKAVAGVAKAARSLGVPCLAIAGEVALSEVELSRLGIAAACDVSDAAGSRELSLSEPARWLSEVARRASEGDLARLLS